MDASPSPSVYRAVTDHLGRAMEIPLRPQRIVSLCPSQTATLFDLGLEDCIAGRTHFCIHPAEQVEKIPRVGGTKQLKMERIREIQPDLVIAEKEENTKEMVEALEAEGIPVYVTDVKDPESCLQMVRDLGSLCGVPEKGQALAREIAAALGRIEPAQTPQKVLYFIWRKPWMVAGRGTFIDSILKLCGITNALQKERYPELKVEEIQALNPQLVLLSSEPYPFAEKHIAELKTYLPDAEYKLVDGEMFSWYGSRMRLAPEYLNGLWT